LQSTF
jgi:hypothetical protein